MKHATKHHETFSLLARVLHINYSIEATKIRVLQGVKMQSTAKQQGESRRGAYIFLMSNYWYITGSYKTQT